MSATTSESTAGGHTGPALPARDRGRRLALFGALGMAAGVGALLLGLLNLALPLIGRMLPAGAAPPPDWRAAIVGALTWALIGAAFLWAGLGSIRCRPWARSVMLTLSWSWLLFGLMTVALSFFLVGDALQQAAERGGGQLPDGAIDALRLLVLGLMAAGGVALPLAFVWAYSGEDVRRTCEARHPDPDWASRCPLPVLGVSLGLVACAVLALPMALNAAVPFFGRIVTGWPAAGLVLAGAVASLALARATYRQQSAGWWGTVTFMVAIGASVMVTFAVADPVEFLIAYGLPPDQVEGFQGLGPAIFWSTAVLTIATVAYLAAVRRHFTAR